ncbi:MAG TPA: carbohydrate ABC transporter permease [Phycisphaerae bacterium]|nr:carbohydrate ABC transporter permease [Phycisphaerae bacterium]
MPIISTVGSRSRRVRLVYGTIYALLLVGAVTMIYPFMLMLSGSMKSEADSVYITPWPQFWFDDVVLFQKYVESKHDVILSDAEAAWGRRIGSWRNIEPPAPSPHLEAFLAWRAKCPWWRPGHTQGGKMLPINARLFRAQMYKRFGGDIHAYRNAMRFPVTTWNGVMPPPPAPGRYPPLPDPMRKAFDEFAAGRPIRDRVLDNPDGAFRRFLKQHYTPSIEDYNQAHGTRLGSYEEVFLTARAPAGGKQREDWEEFVRELASLSLIRLDASLADHFRKYLAAVVYKDIAERNSKCGTKFASFDEVPFPTIVPVNRFEAVDWAGFLKDPKLCPAGKITLHGPRQLFEQFVAQKRGVAAEQVAPIELPIPQADWHDCMAHSSDLRWEFSTRNYKHVFEYLLLHGRGIVNTLIYCSLAIASALVVNPLGAYALSRYKPPSTYKVLLLLMATMAFPGEVTMIPAFLLMKRFPLWPLAGGAVAFGAAVWLLWKLAPRLPEVVRLTAALGAATVVGVWLVPTLIGRPFVSLLNTFAALVVPGMANGFFIFLLKGFFDSLPRELYEAADIDGASEWTKFWTITMSLSKPILAVIALNAFRAAYSAFMMALIIIPDEDMWTMMVWIFQLQSESHQAVVYASLVIAAIPTFLVFVFCQNIIIRGIVVPTEK